MSRYKKKPCCFVFSQILRVLGESAIAVRTKAMKCLSEVVAVDPSILARVSVSLQLRQGTGSLETSDRRNVALFIRLKIK